MKTEIHLYVNTAARVAWGRSKKYVGHEQQARYSSHMVSIPAEWAQYLKTGEDFRKCLKHLGMWSDYEWLGVNNFPEQ